MVGGAVLVAALVRGARPSSAVGGFALGAAFLAFAALSDRRSVLMRRSEPEPLPAGARREPRWLVAWRLMLPSTVAVTVLAVGAVAFGSLVLGAILGGALAGLGLAAALTWVRLAGWESTRGVTLYFELSGAGRCFVEPRGVREPTA